MYNSCTLHILCIYVYIVYRSIQLHNCGKKSPHTLRRAFCVCVCGVLHAIKIVSTLHATMHSDLLCKTQQQGASVHICTQFSHSNAACVYIIVHACTYCNNNKKQLYHNIRIDLRHTSRRDRCVVIVCSDRCAVPRDSLVVYIDYL